MTRGRNQVCLTALIAALVLVAGGCGSAVSSDAVLGDTARLTPANADDLPARLEFATREVKALEKVCDRIDRSDAGKALGGVVSQFGWADAHCDFEVSSPRVRAGRGRLIVEMLAVDGAPGVWRSSRKEIRLSVSTADVGGVGDAAFYVPSMQALYVSDAPSFLLFQYVGESGPVRSDAAGALALIARQALADRIDG